MRVFVFWVHAPEAGYLEVGKLSVLLFPFRKENH